MLQQMQLEKTSQPNSLYNHVVSVHGYTCSQCDFTVIF